MLSQRHIESSPLESLSIDSSPSGIPATRTDDSSPCPLVANDPVLAAAFEVLVDRGPSRTTLTEVARRAGVSRMTVYRRYQALSPLVSEVLTAELTTVLERARAKAVDGSDAQRLAHLVAMVAQQIAEHPLMARLLTRDPESLLPLIVRRKGSTQKAAELLLTALIADSTDGTVAVDDPSSAADTLVTCASAFIFSSARSDAADPQRWEQLRRLALGYLTAAP